MSAVLCRQDGAIATVTLNRPERLNALDSNAWLKLAQTFQRLDADETLRCIVLRGAGNKAFAAGADIEAFAAERSGPAQARRYGETVEEALQSLTNCRHPVVAMIQGACVGGGLVLAACCDLRLASRSARFGAPLNRLGMSMPARELAILFSLAGLGGAMEILLEGRIFDAARAEKLGLVHRVYADDRIESEVYGLAQRIADGAPLVARLHKKIIRRLGLGAPLSEAEIAEGLKLLASEDYREGVRAFLAKEKPRFSGR
jgi:enoyl-CoA hydratase/carnithine racemase